MAGNGNDIRHPQPLFPEPSLRSPQSHRHHSQGSPHSNHTQGQVAAPPTPENLHRSDGGAFNVDPDVPYLEAQAEDARQGRVSPANRNFIGGFFGDMKRVFRGNRRRSPSPEKGIVIITTNPERFQFTSSSPPPELHHLTPPAQPQPMTVAQDQQSFVQPHTSSPSPPANYSSNQATVGHTTDVDPLPEPLIGSPVSVEPQPASDYAKMDSPGPPLSTASLGSYVSRVKNFFRELNNLPWVASERVTVDYYPGLGKRAVRRRSKIFSPSPVPQAPHRPVVSWYGGSNPGQHGPLFSPSSSPSTVMAEVQIQGAQPLPKNARVVYPVVIGPSGVIQYNQPPNAAPVPVYAPATSYAPLSAPAPSAYRATLRTDSSTLSYDGQTYPHGYVPYQQQSAAAAQYAGDAIHNMMHAPVPAPTAVYTVPPRS
jgi:hypothetical protein